MIVADEDTHNEIMKVIKNLDRPKPQVLIKVVFAQVTLNKSLNVGVEGSYTFNVRNGLASGASTTTTNSTGKYHRQHGGDFLHLFRRQRTSLLR